MTTILRAFLILCTAFAAGFARPAPCYGQQGVAAVANPSTRIDQLLALKDQFKGTKRESLKTRVSRLKLLDVDVEKFKALSPSQLVLQWQGKVATVRFHPDVDIFSGKVEVIKDFAPGVPARAVTLKPGEKLRVKRGVFLTASELAELNTTRLHTSNYYSTLNYDQDKISQVTSQNNITLLDSIMAQRAFGFFALSTACGLKRTGVNVYEQSDDFVKAIGEGSQTRYNIILEYDIPAEALVELGKQIPEHVLEDPVGYGFYTAYNALEAEITFVGTMPRQWLVTDFSRALELIKAKAVKKIEN